MVHFLIQPLGARKSCACGAGVVKSYVSDIDGEVTDIVFKCEDTREVIDLP